MLSDTTAYFQCRSRDFKYALTTQDHFVKYRIHIDKYDVITFET